MEGRSFIPISEYNVAKGYYTKLQNKTGNSTSLATGKEKENLCAETDISVLGNFNPTGSVCEIMSLRVNRHFCSSKGHSLWLSMQQLFCFQGA